MDDDGETIAGVVPAQPRDPAATAEQTSARLVRLARQLHDVRAELSALLGLSPLATHRLTSDLKLADLLVQVETLEFRLATLSVGLRRSTGSREERATPKP